MTKIEIMIFLQMLEKFIAAMLFKIGMDEGKAKKEGFLDKVAHYGMENINSDEQITMAAICIHALLNDAEVVSFGPRAEEEER